MSQLSAEEVIKIGVGVWLCIVDGHVEPLETATVFKVIKKDLLPETNDDAVMEVGEWLKAFHQNFLATEQKLQDMIRNHDRIAIIKNQLMEMARTVAAADGTDKVAEEMAINKLKIWLP